MMRELFIEDCCEILDSMRVPITASDREQGEYPYYGANGIQDHVANYIFDDELVLLAEDGGNFGSKSKPIAYRVSGKCWVNNHAHVLKPRAGLDIDYLCYSLMFYKVDGMVNGATRQKLTQAAMRKMKIHMRTMEEQTSIVNRLNHIVSIKKQIEKELQLYDDLIRARFVEMFGDPIANQMKWPVKTLKELSTLITNGNTPKGGSENYVESGITFLRSQNVWRNRIELDDVAYIDEKTHTSMKKSSLHYKDILITKTGRINTENSSLGRAALFLGEDNSANINGHVYLVRLTDEVIPEYVVTILTGEAYRKYIRKVCVGGIDKRQINVDQVENFPIIMPPLDMQKEFEKFVAQVNKSKAVVQKSLDEMQTLFDSLMQQYFG
jgi:type I restriction enzyme S subunit